MPGDRRRVMGGAVVRLTASALLFDSDGVLVDSHAQVEVAWRALADEFDLDYDALATQLVGVPARATLARHLDGARLARAVARLEDLEVETASDTRPIRGAVELLASVPPDRWAIVTSATRRLGEARWRGAGLPGVVHVVTADDIVNGKPAPDPFLAGAARLGVVAASCIVFEDSPSGSAAGVAAGATVVAVGDQMWRTAPAARIVDLSAVHVVDVGVDRGITLALDAVADR